ncbi:Phenoxybenzoate dioxygenase subunit beta [Penicillium rolfsii]|nr:Phenoxybenzoate dioxygenase subunit beta [Penicillium rolfsii]
MTESNGAVPNGCPFQDPRRLFKDLEEQRSIDPIESSDILGGYVVTRYEDIVYALDHPELFASKGATVPEFPEVVQTIFANRVPPGGTLIGWDNPDHDRLRTSVNGFFLPRRLAGFQPLMRSLANELIDRFIMKGEMELKSTFAMPLPLKTVIMIAGLDPARMEWIGRSLALFGGIAGGSLSVEQQVKDVLDLHDYVAQVIQERKTDRRNDLISHIWDQRDANVVEMTDFEHLAMIPGLLLAGHETTTSVLSMGLSHLLHNGLWHAANESDQTRKDTIEELLRYESAITGMFRSVTKATKIGSRDLKPGDKVFLAYNSASRDGSVFECPAELQLKRTFTRQHLGFGRGIHACLGAPLARLLLRTELEILYERLPNLRLVTPYEKIHYEKVGPSRSIEGVVVAWDTPLTSPQRALPQLSKAETASSVMQNISAKVHKLVPLTSEVLEVTLRSEVPEKLPEWTPGSHVDILSQYGYRQYSLCSDPDDNSFWKIAILKEENGSGGSKWLHENLREGMDVTVRRPKNHFRLTQSPRYIFLAGGIGITPLKPMLAEAKRHGADYRLIYLGRSREMMAYVEELAREHPTEVWTSRDGNRFDLERFVKAQEQKVQIYCCGPVRLLDSLEDACRGNPLIEPKIERFQGASPQTFLPNKRFHVTLGRSGRTLTVSPEQTLLEVLNQHGCGIMSTCSKGTCGTCEVSVLDGRPEHRDTVLSLEEKGENKVMMPCVSRCLEEKLVLDLW